MVARRPQTRQMEQLFYDSLPRNHTSLHFCLRVMRSERLVQNLSGESRKLQGTEARATTDGTTVPRFSHSQSLLQPFRQVLRCGLVKVGRRARLAQNLIRICLRNTGPVASMRSLFTLHQLRGRKRLSLCLTQLTLDVMCNFEMIPLCEVF